MYHILNYFDFFFVNFCMLAIMQCSVSIICNIISMCFSRGYLTIFFVENLMYCTKVFILKNNWNGRHPPHVNPTLQF